MNKEDTKAWREACDEWYEKHHSGDMDPSTFQSTLSHMGVFMFEKGLGHSRSGEAVAEVTSWTNGSYHRNYKLKWLKEVDSGTKLFTHSQPAIRQEFDVRRIMLDVVPGVDGMGHEVYAKDTDDVVRVLSDLWQKIEELKSQPAEQRELVRLTDDEIKSLPFLLEATHIYNGEAIVDRDSALEWVNVLQDALIKKNESAPSPAVAQGELNKELLEVHEPDQMEPGYVGWIADRFGETR